MKTDSFDHPMVGESILDGCDINRSIRLMCGSSGQLVKTQSAARIPAAVLAKLAFQTSYNLVTEPLIHHVKGSEGRLCRGALS